MFIFGTFNGHFRLNWGRITLEQKIEQLWGNSNSSSLTLDQGRKRDGDKWGGIDPHPLVDGDWKFGRGLIPLQPWCT